MRTLCGSAVSLARVYSANNEGQQADRKGVRGVHISELFGLGVVDSVAFIPVTCEHLYSLFMGTKAVICTPERQVLAKALFDCYMATRDRRSDSEKAGRKGSDNYRSQLRYW